MDLDVDSRVNTMLQRCGELTDLFIDSSVVSGSGMYGGARDFALNVEIQSVMMRRVLATAPLLEALQADAAECRCSPLGRLSVQSYSASGSKAEGLTEAHCIDRDQRMSDTDVMLELGPVSWVLDASRETGSSPSVPSLKLEATENAGYVRVLQIPGSDCRHGRPLPFSAERVRQSMHDFVHVIHAEANSITVTGPAVTADLGVEVDWVACLRVPWQQSRESFAKTTPLVWLPAYAREDVWRYGMHLVPTGCKGSATEDTEWRLSFSRAELVAAWYLPDDQKYAVVILKRAKRQLGASGRAVKSYFIKTSLYWICQRTPRHRWGGAAQCARRILDYLQAAVAARRLPSFFNEDINLLRQATPADLEAMQQTIGVLQTDLTRVVMRDILQSTRQALSRVVKSVLSSRPVRLSERQLRIYIAREQIVQSAICSQVEHAVASEVLPRFLPTILRISTTKEMLQLSSHLLHPMGCLKRKLLQVMAVAPDDVAGRARLTSCPGGGFTWDVAPLMELLTAEDISEMLVDAPAVFAWWDRQLTRSASEWPAGLSAELGTPRGLAQLVTNSSLLVQALDESVPGWRVRYSRRVLQIRTSRQDMSFQHYKDREMERTLTELTADLQVRLHLSQPNAHRIAQRWQTNIRRYWSDPGAEARFNTYPRDPWQLWQFFCHLLR